MAEFIISEDSAIEQLDYFLEYYDMDLSALPEEQAIAVESAKTQIIRAIRIGNLEISSGAEIAQRLKNPAGDVKSLTYGELTGNSKLAMKNKAQTDNYGRIYALLGSLSGVGEGGIAKLRGADLSLAESIGILFLQI